jgi:zinc transport system ATP-binding protein
LDRITLTIYEKDLIGLIGPNGAGKSTLLSVILGLTKPTSGTVALFGSPISSGNLRKVGYVPQTLHSSISDFPATVFETVLFGRIPRAGPFHRLGKDDYRKVEQSLELMEISYLRDRKLGQLSGGQLQRVLVAKALTLDPELLLLDEPTSGADMHSKTEFYELLKQVNENRGTTVVLSSHDVGTVTNLVSRVVCINSVLFFCGLKSEFTPNILSQTYDYPVAVIEHGNHP